MLGQRIGLGRLVEPGGLVVPALDLLVGLGVVLGSLQEIEGERIGLGALVENLGELDAPRLEVGLGVVDRLAQFLDARLGLLVEFARRLERALLQRLVGQRRQPDDLRDPCSSTPRARRASVFSCSVWPRSSLSSSAGSFGLSAPSARSMP